MKNFILLIIYFFLLTNNSNSIENKILFKVNNEIITSLDILNEIKYLKIINEQFKNTEKKQAFEIAKRSLIREKIKQIELKKSVKKIRIEDQFLNDLIINYFKDIQAETISDLESYFISINIEPDLIKKKLSTEILWNQLIFSKYNQSVKINKQDIISELKKNNKQKEYLLYEILFNLDKNQKLNEKFNLISNKINATNFSETALTFSSSNTASKGGKLGWIKESSLSKKIKDILKDIEKGNYSNPIVVPGGFLILKIQETREAVNDFDLNEETERIIKDRTNEQLNQYSNIYFNKVKKNITINEL
jgi:peptidyl-prolyl cis-trans isomerase SurA